MLPLAGEVTSGPSLGSGAACHRRPAPRRQAEHAMLSIMGQRSNQCARCRATTGCTCDPITDLARLASAKRRWPFAEQTDQMSGETQEPFGCLGCWDETDMA